MKIKLLLASLIVTALACSKGDSPTNTSVASSSSSVSAASASASALASAVASAKAKPVESVETWKGTFKSKPGEVTLNQESSKVVKTWVKDPGTEKIGEGTATLQIPTTQGIVRGEVTGVWGTLIVNGHLEEKELHARLDPKNPNDAEAMTGVLHLTLKGDHFEGKMRVASRDANLVREAEIKLAK